MAVVSNHLRTRLYTLVANSPDAAELIALLGSIPGLGSVGSTSFVLRPGGVAGGNVYTTMAALYADFVLIKGAREIVIDDSIAPIVVGSGSFSFAGAKLTGWSSTGIPAITFNGTAAVTAWFADTVGVRVNVGTAAALVALGGGVAEHRFDIAVITTTAAGPMFSIPLGATLALLATDSLLIGGVAVLVQAGPGAFVNVFLYDGSALGMNTLDDAGHTATIAAKYDASSSVGTQAAATPTVTRSDVAAGSGYDDTVTLPLLGVSNVQSAIDALKGAGIVATAGALPANCFRVDTTATAGDAVARVYATADLAVAAAEASGYTSYTIWLTEGQAHTPWTCATLSGSKVCGFVTGTSLGATLPINAAALPVAVGSPTITFGNVNVTLANTIDCAGYVIAADAAQIDGNGFRLRNANSVRLVDSTLTDVYFQAIGGGGANAGAFATRCTFSFAGSIGGETVMSMNVTASGLISTSGCSWNDTTTAGKTGGLFLGGGGGVTLVIATGDRYHVGSGGVINVANSVSALSQFYVCDFARAAGGTVNFGTQLTTPCTWHGPVPDDAKLPHQAWYNNGGVINQLA